MYVCESAWGACVCMMVGVWGVGGCSCGVGGVGEWVHACMCVVYVCLSICISAGIRSSWWLQETVMKDSQFKLCSISKSILIEKRIADDDYHGFLYENFFHLVCLFGYAIIWILFPIASSLTKIMGPLFFGLLNGRYNLTCEGRPTYLKTCHWCFMAGLGNSVLHVVAWIRDLAPILELVGLFEAFLNFESCLLLIPFW